MKSFVINIEDRDVREEIPVHLFEDYEVESKKVENLILTEKEYEWYNTLSKGLLTQES